MVQKNPFLLELLLVCYSCRYCGSLPYPSRSV